MTLRSESSAFNAATAGCNSTEGLAPESDGGGDEAKDMVGVTVGVDGSTAAIDGVELFDDKLEVRIPIEASFGLRPDFPGA